MADEIQQLTPAAIECQHETVWQRKQRLRFGSRADQIKPLNDAALGRHSRYEDRPWAGSVALDLGVAMAARRR